MAVCTRCAAPLVAGQNFCPNCGDKFIAEAATQAIPFGVLQAEIKAALKEHLKDTKAIELETAEAIVARIGSWAKLFGFFLGIPVAIFLAWLAMLGFTSYSDFVSKISSARSEAVIDIKKTHTDALVEVKQQTERTKKELMAQLSNLEGTSQKIIKDAEAKGKQLQEEAVKLTAQYQILKSELINTTKLASEVKVLTKKVDRLEDLLTSDQEQRIRALISVFETGKPEPNYSSVSVTPGDSMGISYGFVPATRASGTLHSLVVSYLEKPGARYKSELYPFLKPLEARDSKLDSNTKLLTLLEKAGTDPLMQSAQNELFGQLVFLPAFRTAQRLGIRSPLGIAVVLDSAVHGSWGLLRNATIKQTGGSPISGVDERIWLKTYLQKRVEWISSHAYADVRITVYRPKALLDLVEQGNLDLRPPLLIQGVKIEK